MKLSPRLQIIADSIIGCDTLADIGTDHASLPIYLVKKGSVKRAIASDINKGPIEIAEARISSNRLEDKIQTRLGSGLTILKQNEVNIIVIAGMGGMLIADIIEASIEVAKSAEALILQPMLDSGRLRAYLMRNGFEITDEELAKEDRKLYEVIWVRKANKPQPIESFLDIGPKLIEKKHPLVGELVDKKAKEIQKVMNKLVGIETETGKIRLDECQELLKYYNEVRKWLL